MAKKDSAYAVVKDGFYLVRVCEHGGVSEFIDGHLLKVPTVIYSADRKDAKVCGSRAAAHGVAKQIAGQVYAIGKVVWTLDEEKP